MAPTSLEVLIGAVVVPEVRVGGPAPSPEYLERFPPVLVVGFGRSRETGATVAGLRAELARVRATMRAHGHGEPIACCDLEEGAALHFPEATRLPPALALAAADVDPRALDVLDAAGELTGGEARALGVDLVLGPVVDVNTRADNPIIATRSLGDDPAAVTARARRFLRGLARGGAGACLKHFPGHGDTDRDSHTELPRVSRPRGELDRIELRPYRELLASAEPAVDAVMVAHLDVPELTGEPGLPTSLSARVVGGLLQRELGFRGAVLTDALAMGALARFDGVAARALQAGCQGLLCPTDPVRTAEELLDAVRRGALAADVLARAAEAMRALRARRLARAAPAIEVGSAASRALARDLALRALCFHAGSGPPGPPRTPFVLDVPFRGAGAPSLAVLEARLARLLTSGVTSGASSGTRPPAPAVIAVGCTVGAGRGSAGLVADQERALVALARERAGGTGGTGSGGGPGATLIWLGSPQVVPPELWRQAGLSILVAFSPSAPMQEAAAAWIAGEGRAGEPAARGRLPVA